MRFSNIVSFVLLGTAAASVLRRQSGDPDFNGTGTIYVVSGKDIETEDPNNKVGCITNSGRFVSNLNSCGVFTRRDNQPFSSQSGPCSFTDSTAEAGRPQAPQGYAFKCSPSTQPISAFYSIFPTLDPGPGQAWVWTGNLNPYYEALSVPTSGQQLPIWYYTGGIDPPTDRVYFMWLWQKTGN